MASGTSGFTTNFLFLWPSHVKTFAYDFSSKQTHTSFTSFTYIESKRKHNFSNNHWNKPFLPRNSKQIENFIHKPKNIYDRIIQKYLFEIHIRHCILESFFYEILWFVIILFLAWHFELFFCLSEMPWNIQRIQLLCWIYEPTMMNRCKIPALFNAKHLKYFLENNELKRFLFEYNPCDYIDECEQQPSPIFFPSINFRLQIFTYAHNRHNFQFFLCVFLCWLIVDSLWEKSSTKCMRIIMDGFAS